MQFVNDQDELFNDTMQIANNFNSYFFNMGLNMVKDIDNDDTLTVRIPNTVFLRPVTDNELTEHIITLKNGSSPGIDGIKVYIIKKYIRYILQPPKHIIDSIFLKGIVQTQFKTSTVTPIHKAGDKTKINNYPPISIMNNFGKIKSV